MCINGANYSWSCMHDVGMFAEGNYGLSLQVPCDNNNTCVLCFCLPYFKNMFYEHFKQGVHCYIHSSLKYIHIWYSTSAV